MKEFFVSIHLIPASRVLEMCECLGFGGEEDDVLLNHCLLLARYYIYCCKFKNVSPCIGEWVIPEKIHTSPANGTLEILAGGGVEGSGNPGGRGGGFRLKTLLRGSLKM